jgi:hypothetical protein
MRYVDRSSYPWPPQYEAGVAGALTTQVRCSRYANVYCHGILIAVRNVCWAVARKPERTTVLQTSYHVWEDNIKMNFKLMCRTFVVRIQVAQGRVQGQAVVKIVMNPRIS